MLPVGNRRKNKHQLQVKHELLSEVGIRAKPTWYLEDAGLFRIHNTGHIFQREKGALQIYKYTHKLGKNLLCRYKMCVPLSMTQRRTLMLDANERGRRGETRITKRKLGHNFFRNVT